MGTKAYRLPAHVRPSRYDVHLRARVEDSAFSGKVRIQLLLQRPADAIELHARDLDLREARLTMGGRTLEGRAELDADAEVARLTFGERIPGGEAVLDIVYEGKVSANMEGLYLSKDGAEQCLSTQCQETDARAIFPCFDEPAFKASFAWTVTTSADANVVANGALVDVVAESDGSRTWRFAPTRRMSSYILAVIIGNVAANEERIVDGVPMRVWATGGKERLGDFGRDYAAKLLPWFNDYFGVPYAFGKYDQAAVPSFSAGAMENAGLVIFRQTLLLRDPATTSWGQEKTIANVIAHEFAHQWFGNLVTMQWWDDIWLNESFAEWIAHKAVDAVTPEYRPWDGFQASKRSALRADALANTHAIYSPVETPEQATELFDSITYNKGCAVMRMLETFLGEERFRAGIRTYMQQYSERNAKGADLWKHLEQASRQPVARLMESWILQGGYPVVSVSLDGDTLRFSQRRHFSTPRDAGDATWLVPLIVRHADDAGVHETRHLLDAREGTLRLDVQGALRWCHANADGVGFYRQDLDDALRGRLLANLDELTAAEQMDLLDDAWALVRSGDRPIASFLDVLGPVTRRGRNHSVLAQATGRLREIEEMLAEAGDAEALTHMRAWTAQLLADERDRLGFEPQSGESHEARERRVSLLQGFAGIARDEAAIRAAVALADREAEDPASVDPTLAGPVVSLAARVGNASRLERHFALYDERRAARRAPSEAQRYLESFAAFEDPALMAEVLDRARSGFFPLESIGPLLRLMFTQRATREPAWEYLKSEWTAVRERLGDMWTGFLVEHSGNLPPRLRADVVAFYDTNLGNVARQAYGRALEAMDQRAELEARVGPALVEWFRTRTPG